MLNAYKDADRGEHPSGFGAQRLGASGRRMIEAMIEACAIRANWRLWPVAGSKPRQRNCTMRYMGG
jgi:hypothetical protein